MSEENKFIEKGKEINNKFATDISNVSFIEFITNNRWKIHCTDKTVQCEIIEFIGVFNDDTDDEEPVYKSISEDKKKLKVMFLYNMNDKSKTEIYKNIDKLVDNFKYKKYSDNIIINNKDKKILKDKEYNYSPFVWKIKNINNVEWKYAKKYSYESEFVNNCIINLMHYIIGKLNFQGFIIYPDEEKNIMRYYFITYYIVLNNY